MDRELHILILEDVPTDAELMKFELTEAGMTFSARRVDTKETYLKELEGFVPNIILSDYSLPTFDGLSALKIAADRCPDVPFIFVSGALGEELAIELLKKGATDYVLKDRMSRLAPAVSRALQEVQERTELKRIENALKDSEVKYRTIFENTGAATLIIDENAAIVLVNRQFEQLSGYSRGELEGKKKWVDFVFEEDLAKVKGIKWPAEKTHRKTAPGYEFRLADRGGEVKDVFATLAAIPATHTAVLSLLDISERKLAEEALKKREQELEIQSQNLEEANTALKVLLKHREEDKITLEEQILANVNKLVFPNLEVLKALHLNETQLAHVRIIEQHLHDIVSPFLRNLSSSYLNLTPREIQIASLVKDGKTTKEITDLLNISATAVDFHRKNLRSKFGIKNKRTNLRSYLTTLS